jgi:hypothetical protein
MNLPAFHQKRTAIQTNVSPGTGPEVTSVEANLREVLMASGLFEEVEVEQTDDPDQLVIALCQFRPFLTEHDVADRLEEVWNDRVRFPFWEAHGLHTEDGHVEFEAASRAGVESGYVTVHLVAQRAGIPAQRTGER